MFTFWKKKPQSLELLSSKLYDEKTFYNQFIQDLYECNEEVIIESPYITTYRMQKMLPVFMKLLNRGVSIHIITRNPEEHDESIRYQATNEILRCKELGINIVLIKGNHHRKLAILDRITLWEGSLNILSQNDSQEIMRKIKSKKLTLEIFNFLRLNRMI